MVLVSEGLVLVLVLVSDLGGLATTLFSNKSDKMRLFPFLLALEFAQFLSIFKFILSENHLKAS